MTLREYFCARSSEALVMAREIWHAQGEMSVQAQTPRLKGLLERQSRALRHDISNLEQVVDRVGGMRGTEESGLSGYLGEERRLVAGQAPGALLDIHLLLESDRLAHLEIATYTGLVALARQLGDPALVTLLQQNLSGEEKAGWQLESEIPSLVAELGARLHKAA
jgi:ferritin-like metal-binding protein YciE